MTVYTLKAEDGETNLYLTERNLYGSSRLGVEQVNEVVASTSSGSITINTAQQRVVGDKRYELSNHLGNVLATVTDRKLPEFDATESLAYYKPDVVSYSDYMPFGMQMAERNGSTGEYRYGFQGQEKDDEVHNSEGTSYTAEYWQYDSRLGRRWNIDPVVKYQESPYASFANNPIWFIDPNGADTSFADNNSRIDFLETKTKIDTKIDEISLMIDDYAKQWQESNYTDNKSKTTVEYLNKARSELFEMQQAFELIIESDEMFYFQSLGQMGSEYGNQVGGKITYNEIEKRIEITIPRGNGASAVHEITHGAQHVEGYLDLKKMKGAYDYEDEFGAYRNENNYIKHIDKGTYIGEKTIRQHISSKYSMIQHIVKEFRQICVE